VLDHVDAEQLERDGVDRRRQRREKSDEPQQEQRGPPRGPAAARASTAEVDRGCDDDEDAQD